MDKLINNRCKTLRFLRALVAMVTLLQFGCEATETRDGGAPRPARRHAPFSADQAAFSGTNALSHLRGAMQKASVDDPDADLLWALAFCRCAPKKVGEYLAKRAEMEGPLPQPLVPSIKKEILADSKLQFLLRLKSNFTTLGGALERLFANDDKIAESVRTGIAEKFTASLAPKGTRLAENIPFRFDLFVPATGKTRRDQKIDSMSIADQAVIWSLPFAREEMWKDSPALAFGDHGLQFLYAAKALASWQYAYGLRAEGDSPDTDAGGLAFDPQGDQSAIGPFDPRSAKGKPMRIVSGTYRVQFSGEGSIDLATNVTPRWRRDADPITLKEQATLAIGAATAFRRMRPENRGQLRTAFGGSGMFPDNTHELPLIFLAGLGELLKGTLLDGEKQEIYQEAQPGSASGHKRADLPSLTRLAAALSMWIEETKDMKNAAIGTDTRKQLEAGNRELFRALQLTVQTILANYVRLGSFTTDEPAYSLVVDTNGTPPTAATAAELLAVLSGSVLRQLDSPLLDERVAELANWFAATYLDDASGNAIEPAAILWSAVLVDNLTNAADHIPADTVPWADPAQTGLKRLIEEWSL